MFTLRINSVLPAGEVRPAPGAARVQIWRDLGDEVCAYGYAGPGWWAVDWLRTGWFELDAASHTVIVTPHPTGQGAAGLDAPPAIDRIDDVYRRSVLPLLLQAAGHETLHASAVTTASGVLALCGERQAGKSTVAFALARRGFSQYADDTLVLEIGASAITTVPLPFSPRLRPVSAQHFDAPGRDQAARAVGNGSRETLAAVFVLRPVDGAGAPSVRALTATEGFQAILPHAHCFEPDSIPMRRRLTTNYLEVSARVPVFAVTYAPGLDRLDALLDNVLAAAGHANEMAVVR